MIYKSQPIFRIGLFVLTWLTTGVLAFGGDIETVAIRGTSSAEAFYRFFHLGDGRAKGSFSSAYDNAPVFRIDLDGKVTFDSPYGRTLFEVSCGYAVSGQSLHDLAVDIGKEAMDGMDRRDKLRKAYRYEVEGAGYVITFDGKLGTGEPYSGILDHHKHRIDFVEPNAKPLGISVAPTGFTKDLEPIYRDGAFTLLGEGHPAFPADAPLQLSQEIRSTADCVPTPKDQLLAPEFAEQRGSLRRLHESFSAMPQPSMKHQLPHLQGLRPPPMPPSASQTRRTLGVIRNLSKILP